MIPGVDTTFIFQPSERLDTTLYFYPISITSDGNYLWIGSGDSGIVRYEDNESEFTYYNVQSGHLPTNYTYKIELDDSGYFWLATDSGLVKWDGDSILQIWNTSNSQMPGNEFFDLDFDKQGNIWVAFSPTWSNDTIDLSCKIGKFDGSNWTIYDTTNSGLPKNLSDDFIDLALPSSIAIDNFNNKWIGTFKGLFRYDDSTWTTYNIPGSDTNANKNLIQDVAIDSLGNIWLGTFEGLVCFNENGIVTATDKKDEGDLNPMTTFFPNPSDKTVKVKYNVEKPGQVHCEVYYSGGRFIGKYINKYTEAGEQEAIINTSGFAPGVYMFKMKIGNRTEVKKVVVK
jgi:ligand-binding sensor domain-containing protein